MKKKEAAIGSFADHLAHSPGLVKNISDDLRALDKLIVQPNAVNGELSEDDIQLFPLLRNLTLVAGVNWPSRVAAYRDKHGQTDADQPAFFNGYLTSRQRMVWPFAAERLFFSLFR
ncbi:glutaredoxin 2 [Klebsiella michiganensis]|nr:glutaredoxin 2 [Klebsiella michiganensis]